MPGYAEQVKGYNLELSTDNNTGTRLFLKVPGGPDDLPDLGDPFDPIDFPDILAIKKSLSWLGDLPGNDLWTVSYSTVPIIDENTPFDDLTRNLDISMEFLNVGKTKEYSGGSGGGKVKQDVFMRVMSATLRIPKVYTDFEDLLDISKQVLGTTNVNVWLGQAVNTFLVTGCSSNEYYTDLGAARWRAEWAFEFRAPIITSAPTYGNWNYVFDEKADAWKELDVPVYEETDFPTIIF